MAIIVDRRFVEKAIELWGDKYEILPSFCCEALQTPVNSHPDMTITPVGDIFVCCPEGYNYYKKLLGDRVVSGRTSLFCDYPHDIAYNVLVYKNFAFCKEEHTDPVVKEELTKRNIKIVNVNQGYSKCSAAVCDEGIITADKSIFSAAKASGIKTLMITPGHVEITGYEYGFIGGASGAIDGELNFFGDLSKHPDFKKINEFCKSKYFDGFPLTDIGTFFCI